MTRIMNKSLMPLLGAGLLLFLAAGCVSTPAVRKTGYSVQVGAFSVVENAERLSERLRSRGIDAYYFRKEGGLYAVRFGDFPTPKAAGDRADKLVSEGLVTAYFVVPPGGAEARGPAQPKPPAPAPGVKEPGEPGLGYVAARTAERFVGIPYRWGGNNVVEGMDCSGFVRAVYHLCGLTIPRTAAEQYKAGRSLKRGDLEDGDLVFFGSSRGKISHVGIYVGSGRFVHAPRRGEDIRFASLEGVGPSLKFAGARRYF